MKAIFSKVKSTTVFSILVLASCSSRKAGFLDGNPFEGSVSHQVKNLPPTPKRERLRVVFTGRVSGFLASCGCSVDPKGGLDRRWNALERFRSEFLKEGMPPNNFIVLDAGNALFENRRIDLTQKSQEQHRAGLFLEGQAALGIQVQNVGVNDLALGYNYLISDAVFGKYLSTNIVSSTKKPVFKTELKLLEAKVLVLGLTEPTQGLPDGLRALDPVPLVQSRLKGLGPDWTVIVLSDMGQKLDRALGEAIDFPLLIIASRDPSSLELPLVSRKSLIVQNQIQGQQWGLLDIWRPASGYEGWYSPDLGQRFEQRWNELAKEEKAKAKIKSDAEKDYEFDKLSAVALDLKKYAPGELNKKALFSYWLIDMNANFDQKNALSELMLKAAAGPSLESQLAPLGADNPTLKKKLRKRH